MTTYNITNHNVLDQLQGYEVTVYEKIKRFMDFTTLKAEVSIRRLADECKLSKNTVIKYIKKLIDKGLLLKRKEWNDKENQYKTNQYYFIAELGKSYAQVVQKKKEVVQQKGQYKKTNRTDVIDPQTIKEELTKKYGQDIVEKALQQMSISIERGTNIINIKAYLSKVCANIQAQQEMAKGISQISNKKSANKGIKAKKNSPKLGGWGSSSISHVSSNYSNDELEDIMLKKRFKKYGF